MANTSGQTNANDSGNKGSEDAQRDSEPHIQKSETEGKGVNPGRTPGKAEGVEDSEERGNQ